MSYSGGIVTQGSSYLVLRMTGIEEAADLLKVNKLKAAIELVAEDLRNHPADVRSRTFLFELLCFAGEWARAEKAVRDYATPECRQ